MDEIKMLCTVIQSMQSQLTILNREILFLKEEVSNIKMRQLYK